MKEASEKIIEPVDGVKMLVLALLLFVISFVFYAVGVFIIIFPIALLVGFYTVQPNEARVLVLFGKYKGTVKKSGFHWGNPLYSRVKRVEVKHTNTENPLSMESYKVSLRSRTLNISTIKVNDKGGNPIEIGAVLIWKIDDTYKAMFDVDHYWSFVSTQSETALRYLASQYPYDGNEETDISLRGNIEEISNSLKEELQKRVEIAGLLIEDARLSHLAYSPEIAQVMLRRQQAEAIIQARQKIVYGAVSMVDLAIKELKEKDVVVFNEADTSKLVTNLMVVLCSENDVQPVINSGHN